MKESALSASAALAAFSEPYVESRRVLVFGSSLSAVPRLLVERGARIVQVCDPNPTRVEEASERLSAPGLSFATFTDELLQSRESSFDFVLVENLAAFEARAVVARAKRLLAARGIALFATPNRESSAPLLPPPEPAAAPLDYYALYDHAAAEFEYVRMLGQAPFVGYAIVDFAPTGDPEPVIDSELVPRGSEEPELFVAVASRHRASVAGYSVIQLPMHRVLARSPMAEAAAPPPVAVRTGRGPSGEIEQKVRRQEAWIHELEQRAETADARADAAEDELESLRTELDELRARPGRNALAVLPAPDEARRADELNAALEAKSRLEQHVAELDATLTEREVVIARHAAEMADRDHAVAERDTALEKRNVAIADRDRAILERDQKLGELELLASADPSDDLGRLERQLEERGQEIRRLERDLAEAERVGRDLVRELGSAREPDGASDARPDELTALLAKSEADRQALAWCRALADSGEPPTGERVR
jgi:SAM-dependent methyltransferase